MNLYDLLFKRVTISFENKFDVSLRHITTVLSGGIDIKLSKIIKNKLYQRNKLFTHEELQRYSSNLEKFFDNVLSAMELSILKKSENESLGSVT